MIYSYHWQVVHHKSRRRQSFKVITCAEDPAVQNFPRVSKITPNTGVTLAGNIFPFSLTQILCHSILIWKILYDKTRPVICYHPFPPPYYVWDAANMQTQKVSKVPPFYGTILALFAQQYVNYSLNIVSCTNTNTIASNSIPLLEQIFSYIWPVFAHFIRQRHRVKFHFASEFLLEIKLT